MVADKLGQILLRAGFVDEAGLQRAFAEQQHNGGSLGDQLVRMQMISEETLIRALSTQYRLPAVALDAQRLDPATVRCIPQELCERYRLVCFRADSAQRMLDVALADPGQPEAIERVKQATQCQLRPHIAAASAISEALRYAFGNSGMRSRESASLSGAMRLPRAPSAQRIEPSAAGRPLGEAAPQLEVKVTPARRTERPPAVTAVNLGAVDAQSSRTTAQNRAYDGMTDGLEFDVPADHAAQQGGIDMRPATTGDNFHITMDVPALDKAALAAAKPPAEKRLDRLETTTARETGILRQLVSILLRKGVLTRAEVENILRE